MLEITPSELQAKLARGERVALLDVREAEEVAFCTLPRAQHLPMMDLFVGTAAPAAAPEAELVVYCHHGIRSLEAVRFLRQRGYPRALSLRGGIDAWSRTIDPTLRRY
ncbi:MAG: rhodanese-like domain-containing protein [Planctomycetaceae bacterium]